MTRNLVLGVALLVGLAIGFVDSRPSWDDTGITVGALILSSLLLGLAKPRYWWVTGLLVGLPVPAFNYFRTGDLTPAVAVVIALAAAGAGGAIGKTTGRAAPSR